MKQRDQILREAKENIAFARELDHAAQAQAAAAPADEVARWREEGDRRERERAAAREERASYEREQQQQFTAWVNDLIDARAKIVAERLVAEALVGVQAVADATDKQFTTMFAKLNQLQELLTQLNAHDKRELDLPAMGLRTSTRFN